MEKRYTSKEVAELYRVSVGTVWGWIRAGKLSATRFGRTYYITQTDIEAMERAYSSPVNKSGAV